MKRILITGANGFIGQNLICKLKKNNVIFGLDRYEINQLDKEHSFIVDIRDSNKISEVFQNYQFDILIHLAAIVHKNNVDTSEENYNLVNYECAKHLFDLCKKNSIRVIFASTVEVYGNVDSKVINEDTKCYPISFYAKAKLRAEQYLQNNNENHIILRLSAVYGKNFTLNIDKRIFLKKNKLAYFFNEGDYTFNFCSIENLCNFVNYIIHNEKICGTYIISDSSSLSALDIINIYRKHNPSLNIIKIPYKLACFGIGLLNIKTKIIKNKDSFFSKSNFNKLFQSLIYDNKKASDLIEFEWNIENTLYGE